MQKPSQLESKLGLTAGQPVKFVIFRSYSESGPEEENKESKHDSVEEKYITYAADGDQLNFDKDKE